MKKSEINKIMKGFVPSTLFDTSVADVVCMKEGEGTPLPKEFIDYLASIGNQMRFVCSTYPFAMAPFDKSGNTNMYNHITCDTFEYAPKTYEDLVRPMCEWLYEIESTEQFDHCLHDTEGVWIEEIRVGFANDGKSVAVSMELGS